MKHEIKIWPEAVLVARAQPVTNFGSEELKQLVADMFETMYDAPGVGLAAPQIGLPLQLAVLDSTTRPGGRTLVMANPVITSRGKLVDFAEGCLSVPGEQHPTQRNETVTVEYFTAEGVKESFAAEGFTAIVIQHEVDHLQGVLYLDQLSSLKRDLIRRKMAKIRKGQAHRHDDDGDEDD